MILIIRRALFAWLLADGDMHLKNMALLKIAEPGGAQFRSVRAAPIYDAVTTRVFPRLQHDRMALKLNGRDDHLRRADFRALASTAGVRAVEADAAIDETLARMKETINGIAPPDLPDHRAEAASVVDKMIAIIRGQLDSFS